MIGKKKKSPDKRNNAMIIVFGSINMDLNMGVKRFPAPGETVISLDYTTTPGGKGANQALAAARTGEKTALVGKVGDDGMGMRILNSLRRNEVMTSGVATAEALPTGLAVITRNSEGENQIVIAAGANAEVQAEQVPDEILKPGNVLLLQMETPWQQSLDIIRRAKERETLVILNAAPVRSFATEALQHVDYLVVNELEAAQLIEMLALPAGSNPAHRVKALAQKAQVTCIITMGEKGLISVDPDGGLWIVHAMKLGDSVVDTTGAGDCFCGTLAGALHAKTPLPLALRRASVAAGLSCLKTGIHEAYPFSGDIDENLETIAEPVYSKI